jgi:hypothetical protein
MAVVEVGAEAPAARLQMLLSVVMARRVAHTAGAADVAAGHKILALEVNFRNRAALAQLAQSASFGAQDAHFLQLTRVIYNEHEMARWSDP